MAAPAPYRSALSLASAMASSSTSIAVTAAPIVAATIALAP
jgi:hypothetical protein